MGWVISFAVIKQIGDVLAGAWASQAERVATGAADRLYLTRVMPLQGQDAILGNAQWPPGTFPAAVYIRATRPVGAGS